MRDAKCECEVQDAGLGSGVEAVGPAPAGDDVGLFGFEGGGGEVDGVGGAGGVVGDEAEVGGDPGEVEGGHGAEQVAAIEGAEVEGEGEVVDDAGPEVGLHGEGVGGELGELFEGEAGLGREDEGPDLLEVVLGEAEGLEHGVDFGGGGELGEGGRGGVAGGWGGDAAGALPEGGLGFDVGEEGAGDGGEEGVEVGLGVGWRGSGGGASPAETSRTEKPAAAASATGQRREEPWLRAMRRWVVETRRWARRPEMAASMGRGKWMSAPKRARERG